ncbi:Xaa-Pro aminopeptidase [Litorimonas taeanensis]|uniref:Xaa-Pro aminopeptidase n=1 Tax=Litorimonas taeanensis TaxID=568099 RepID=A0A420WLD9_9PROT|nr:aminopeptidase P family protein [Litorimonas taeanensis]RKQ71695.1 Xaa-Pro aminopeptidase [Litorimonas taeanensis]
MNDITLFQNFDVKGGPELGRKNLPILQAALKAKGLDGFIVPHEDEYQNEYLPASTDRLQWVSGFTGSAGAGVVMQDSAAIFTDGRYTIQVQQQVDNTLFAYENLEGGGVAAWLRANVKKGQTIGFDPRLHSPAALSRLVSAIENAGGKAIALSPNPIDVAWTDRPPAPLTPIQIQPVALAGKSHGEKRAEIAEAIAYQNADCALITAPPSIAWLLNIRGGDVQCTPLPLSTAIIRKDGHVDFFVNAKKVSSEISQHLGNEVAIHKEEDLEDALKSLSGKTIIMDPDTASAWHFGTAENAGAKVKRAMDPVALPKAKKNSAELNGSAAAHRRDAVPLIQFLHWLDTDAQSGEYDEIDAATKLETLRHRNGGLKDLSFETISGAGANGALCHYRVSVATTLKLEKDSLFLVDSGGQYQDGTTDVTRTVPIGTPTDEMRDRFTRVLKGHIALATIRFPKGTTGPALDAFARAPLWAVGLDYDHGTGHGVGVFLGVHEGPQRISKAPNSVALEPGMIVSNEPGFYKAGEYGIRIENLQFVTEPQDIAGGERPMMGFETLTLAPIHKALIDTDLLTREEIHYVNEYHALVLREIGPKLDGEIFTWLEKACAPL